jgi:hypothetical protein
MTRKRIIEVVVIVLAFAVAVFAATRILERVVAPAAPAAGSAPAAATTPAVPHVVATVFYGTEDGQGLASVKREVPLEQSPRAQGRQILDAELDTPPAPYLPVIPKGTMLRAFYITDRGDAFVDLSPEIATAHPGGSTNELLTVYAIVNAVTANLSSVQRVQILIDGKQADTLAGHVDLRRPFERDTSLVRETK